MASKEVYVKHFRTLTALSLIAFAVVLPGAISPASAAPKVIKISHPGPPDHPWQKALEKYAGLVAERTNGTYKMEIYPNAQLSGGNERTMAEQLMVGTQQMGLFPSSLGNQAMLAFNLPFLFADRETIDKICDGPLGVEMLALHDKFGLKALAFWENGYRQITNNVRPILTPADMKGLKIRAPHAVQIIEAVKALGATPVPVSLGELYMALSQGIVDGQENPISSIYKFKFYEVQKYMTVINYSWSPVTLAMNKDFFDRLPKDIQKIVADTARELAPYARQLVQDEDAVYLKKLKEQGMTVEILNKEQITAFREATKGVADIMKPKVGEEIIVKFQNAAK